jgi:A/G-specific adenine glycosylase
MPSSSTFSNNAIIRNRIILPHARRAMAPRKKAATASKPKVINATIQKPSSPLSTALPPSRAHHAAYHYPVLMSDRGACDALLSWFDGMEDSRSMPWRKKWLDPRDFEGREEELGGVLGKRAYEVWVSEVSK